MSITATALAVGLTRVSALTNAPSKSAPRPGVFRNLSISNAGPGAVFVGGADVTSSGVTAGLQLAAGSAISLELRYDDVPYIIGAAAGPADVRCIHSGL